MNEPLWRTPPGVPCRHSCRHLLLALASFTASAQTFNISGTLVDNDSASPIPRARILLSASAAHQWTITTSSDGKFSFDVPQGKYALAAVRREWRETFGMVSPSSGYGSAIIAGPDQDTSHLIFHWFAPAAIFGKVVDNRGEPVENAAVQLIRESIVAGRKITAPLSTQRTDDLGDYRFAPLAGGTYYLMVSGQPWYAPNLNFMHTAQSHEPSPPPVTFSPASSSVVLKPGAEMEANFTMREVIGLRVLGNCTERCAAASMSLYLQGIGGAETLQGSTFIHNSPQEGLNAPKIPAIVPPGRYSVRYVTPQGSMHKTVEVGTADVTVEVTPRPAPSIVGKVAFANPPRSTVYLRLINEATGSAIARAVDRDGSFTWNSVGVARYRPLLGGTDGLFIAQIAVEGAANKDGVIDIVDGSVIKMNIAASDQTGRLKGFVKTGDRPVPAALVVLAPRVPSTDPHVYRGFQTESDGSFDFTNVPAGDYLLFAMDRVDLEYTNPEAVGPYLARAKPFRIEPHGVYTETISLSAGAP